jgi:hypothetical protein
LDSAVQATRPGHVSTSIAQDFADFRNAVSASFVPLHVTSNEPGRFWGRIRACTVDDVHVTEIRAAEHVIERTPALITAGDRQYYEPSLLLAGTGLLIQDGREAVMQAGDLAVYDTQRPYTLAMDDDFRTMVLMFPHHLLDLPPALVGQLTAVPMSGREGLGSVVAPFLARLVDDLEQFAGPVGGRLAHNAIDLVSTMVASTLAVEPGAHDRHHALVEQIRRYIDRQLAAPRPRAGTDRRGPLRLHSAPPRALPRTGRHGLELDPGAAAGTLPPRAARPRQHRAADRSDRGEVGLRRRGALQPGVPGGIRAVAERAARQPGLTRSERELSRGERLRRRS